jgi:O-antigen biosynthesis protein WbqP
LSYQKLHIKRIIDILVSLIGIIILSPFFVFAIVSIKYSSDGPIFFKQKRVGKNKNTFDILKFRTMMIDAPKDTPTHLLSDPDRYITKIGLFLRKTSLDELPQLWNIIIGDMSIIGPRPALWNQDDLIKERDKYGANNVLPGLTGWAQINGRDELPISVKARLDGEYVKKLSFKMDVICFLGTIKSVVKREGVREGGIKNSYQRETASSKESNN